MPPFRTLRYHHAMKSFTGYAFFALCLAAAATVLSPGSGVAVQFLNGQAAAVTGDSLTVGAVGHPNRTVRLWGIEAPPMTDDRDYGLYARAALDDLLRQHGTLVQCVIDSFDLNAAVCRSGEVDLGEEMLKTGWAVADRSVTLTDVPGGDSERTRRAETYHRAEAEARQARRGRWANMPQ